MIIEFAALAGLAGKIINVWAVYSENKQKRLDREHQRELQKAQRKHERQLLKYKSKPHESALNIPDIDKDFLNRLTMEAGLLSEMGFDVVYEPLDAGYGLALTISKDLTVAFLIPLSYPNQAPLVFIKTASNIEQIDFAPDTWQAEHTIAEVVSALTD
jgi:hypothetical protein